MSSPNRVGELLAEKYRLEALLGAGGMGSVYRARNEQIGRAVAIKVLREEHAQNADLVERFLREASTANLVRHPNVVDVLDVGKDASGIPFIVQELLHGEDLAHYAHRLGGKLAATEVTELLAPIIEALAEAHARGIVHRDIKPENVFLATSGRTRTPKLLDFGISKVRTPNSRMTAVGVMMGTPAYMAPEQIQGARDVDARSDVWGIGVVMFELLAGRLPFVAAEAPALFVAIATTDAPRLVDVAPHVPVPLSKIVERCLRRRASERYPSAAELARDLNHLMEGEEIEPTQRRSLPPLSLRGGAPPAIPKPPSVPRELPSLAPPKPTPSSGRMKAVVPGQPPPSPKSKPRLPAVSPTQPSAQRHEPRPDLRPGEQLPGVLLAAQTADGRAPISSRGRVAMRDRGRVDAPNPVIGMTAVGLVAVAGLGILMAVFHRDEGWPIVRSMLSLEGVGFTVLQVGLAAAALLLGATRLRQGVQQWNGDTAGGVIGAGVAGAMAAGFFFCAVELARAAL